MSCEGVPAWQLMQALSDYFDVTILVYDDVKDRKIHADFKDMHLDQVLDSVAWMVGIEWIEAAGIYYVGGNRDSVIVRDSANIDQRIENIFGDNVSVLGDKLILRGTEREIKLIREAIDEINKKDYIQVDIVGFEVSYDTDKEFGLDWDKTLKYTVNWSDIVDWKYFEPTQTLAMHIASNLKLDAADEYIKTVIDTNLGILSGGEAHITSGSTLDREVFTESDEGNRVRSGFDTQESGLIVTIKGFKQKDSWIFDTEFEDSTAISNTEESKTVINTNVQLKEGETKLIGRIIKDIKNDSFTEGVPFLADIPIFGYLFRVSRKRTIITEVVFYMRYSTQVKEKIEGG